METLITKLNIDEIRSVFIFLSHEDLYHLMLVSTSIHDLIQHDAFWFMFLNAHYPQLSSTFNNSTTELLPIVKSLKSPAFDSENAFLDYLTFRNNNRTVSCTIDDLLVRMQHPIAIKDVVYIMDLFVDQNADVSSGIGLITSDAIERIGGLKAPAFVDPRKEDNHVPHALSNYFYLGYFYFPDPQQTDPCFDIVQFQYPPEFPPRLFNVGFFTNGFLCACTQNLGYFDTWVAPIRMEVNLTKKFAETNKTGFIKFFTSDKLLLTIRGFYDLDDPKPYDVYPVVNIAQNWIMTVSAHYVPLDQYDVDSKQHHGNPDYLMTKAPTEAPDM